MYKQIQTFQIQRKGKTVSTLYTTDGNGIRKWLRKMRPDDKLIIIEIKQKNDN